MTLCSCYPHDGSHLSPCDPAGCRRLLRQPGTVASRVLVIMHTYCPTFHHLKFLLHPCGMAGWVEWRQKLTCRRVLHQNQHHGVVHALGTWGTWSLTLKSPQHGLLVPWTCFVWGGARYITRPCCLSHESEEVGADCWRKMHCFRAQVTHVLLVGKQVFS